MYTALFNQRTAWRSSSSLLVLIYIDWPKFEKVMLVGYSRKPPVYHFGGLVERR